jgi:uncharacterized membrane protein (DUF106 family)
LSDFLLNNWLPDDWQLVLITVCLSLIIIALIVDVLRKTFITKAEFAQLRAEFDQVAQDVENLTSAEERRLMTQLKVSRKDGDEPPPKAASIHDLKPL